MTEPKSYPVSASLLQELVNYLQTKPWQEVNGFLMALMQVARAVDVPIAPPVEEEKPKPVKAEKLKPSVTVSRL